MKIICASPIALILLSGCTAIPTVQYRHVKSSTDMIGMSDAYFLQKSAISITIDEQAQKDNQGNPVAYAYTLTVTSIPKEDTSKKIAVRPKKNWMGETRLSIAKQENTDLPSSIGTEVSNDVVKNTTEVGSVIVKAISLAALAGAAEDRTPPCLDATKGSYSLTVTPNKPGAHSTSEDGNAAKSEANCVKINYEPIPPDALEFAKAPLTEESSLFYYAACRRATVTVVHRGKPLTAEVRISDPTYVQAVEFPAKGSLKMHSQCGVSVLSEKAVNQAPASAILDALATQGTAIKEALEAAKK